MKVSEIIAIALREPDVELRSALVDRLCGDDLDLNRRVRDRLDPDDATEAYPEGGGTGPLEVGAERAPRPVAGESGLERVGTQIGPYKLLQQIGEGGMGQVFLAEQTEPVRRRVALKIIKPGMDTRQVVARFEAERQALAMMDHPNIATVFDAGSTGRGLPYFVMELVKGTPITEFCDARKLPAEQRLSLFISVCRAVQHAHQKGVIHRDLKPSNILVAEVDGRPIVKIIDFGVAKATGPQLTDSTVFTEIGQVIGTVEYMSPEQAQSNALDLDTRSDIYSLGVVLYALLTGETPFGSQRLRGVAWDEMLRILREEEPQRPSLRLGSSASIERVATLRSIEPKRLFATVRGDLDWIVLRTLEKDRNRRYSSASELADDIGRYLAQEPVLAGPPTGLYRISKFARRNRTTLLILALVFGTGAALLWWTAVESARRDQEIKTRSQRTEQALQEGAALMATAEASPIGDEAAWDAAWVQRQRIEDVLFQGPVEESVDERARVFLEESLDRHERRTIAARIEEVLVRGATSSDLASWQGMEREMREFFQEHGFDLEKEDPAVIGERIREDPRAALWSDLLELWIATRGQMAVLGGPRVTAETMQPWADALYVADPDPVRTGIRKFLYQGPRTLEHLERITEGVDPQTLSSRTLSWLANVYVIAGSIERSDALYEIGLDRFPRDFMFAHDYAYALATQSRWQEASRIYQRCLAIRDDVAGVWKGYARALRELGEVEAANRAQQKAARLETRESSSS